MSDWQERERRHACERPSAPRRPRQRGRERGQGGAATGRSLTALYRDMSLRFWGHAARRDIQKRIAAYTIPNVCGYAHGGWILWVGGWVGERVCEWVGGWVGG